MLTSYNDHIKKFGTKETTIDRIGNNGNYSKENCRWATYKEQCRNTRKNRLITYRGQTMCLQEWCEDLGVAQSTLWNRLYVLKWPLSRALMEK